GCHRDFLRTVLSRPSKWIGSCLRPPISSAASVAFYAASVALYDVQPHRDWFLRGEPFSGGFASLCRQCDNGEFVQGLFFSGPVATTRPRDSCRPAFFYLRQTGGGPPLCPARMTNAHWVFRISQSVSVGGG